MDPQTRNFADLRAQFAQAHTKNLIIIPSSVESVFWPYLTRSAGDHPWKQCSSAVLELRGEQTELIAPKAEAVPGEG